jgi:hypothetical protein
MKKIGSFLLQGLMMVAFSALLAVITIEWFAGCGEYYIDSRGNVIPNECVFLDFPKGK